MRDIVITDDLCRAITEADGNVRFVTGSGEVLGRLEPELSPAEMAEIRRRLASSEPRYTTREVLDRLGSAPAP
jgi:hypothetical protein